MPKNKGKRGRKKGKKIFKTKKKLVLKKSVNKNISKTADEKIPISKIKKQPTEAKKYSINDYVVYPKHGVGKIVSVDKAKIGDIDFKEVTYVVIISLIISLLSTVFPAYRSLQIDPIKTLKND